MRWAMGMTALALAAGASFAQQAKYDLSKKPSFLPGDVATINTTVEESTEGTGEGATLPVVKSTCQTACRWEVLAADANGAPTEMRLTVQSADLSEKVTYPDWSVASQKTSLRDLCVTAKTDGNRFVWDTAGIVSKEPNVLSGAQIALLKQVMERGDDWAPYPADAAALMPTEPVPMKHTWEPAGEDIRTWATGIPMARSIRPQVRSAEFRLASTLGSVATVEGNMAFSSDRKGAKLDLRVFLRNRIDTVSGRWTESSGTMSLSGKQDDDEVKASQSRKRTVLFVRGAGKPSAAPAWKNKVGWDRPSPDTNAYKDPVRGISLDLPKEFKKDRPKPPSRAHALFVSSDASISLTLMGVRAHVELTELDFNKALKAQLEGYQVVSTVYLTLADGVPAVLITATYEQGRGNAVSIAGLDGRRCVGCVLVAPPESKTSVEALTKIAKTMRLFEPEDRLAR